VFSHADPHLTAEKPHAWKPAIPRRLEILCAALDGARDCDIIVTIGGHVRAIHDPVGPRFRKLGADKFDFYKDSDENQGRR